MHVDELDQLLVTSIVNTIGKYCLSTSQYKDSPVRLVAMFCENIIFCEITFQMRLKPLRLKKLIANKKNNPVKCAAVV